MEYFEQIGRALQTVLGVLAYILLSYALPRELIRASLRKHYREWISIGAYWHRNYDKWVIHGRVFYIDEFWGDIQVALFCGFVLGTGATYTLSWFTKTDVPFLYLGTIFWSAVLFFVVAQMDRVQLIDAELERKRLSSSGFDPGLELRKLLEGDRRWLKKVVERQPVTR